MPRKLNEARCESQECFFTVLLAKITALHLLASIKNNIINRGCEDAGKIQSVLPKFLGAVRVHQASLLAR